MEKLYYEDPYQKEFIAEIIDVLEKDGKYHVELDKSYFYPNSESQSYDSGSINDVPVSYVYEENEKIYHVLDIKPLRIHRVKCIIDFHKKFDYMQQHLGAHILSACFAELFNANTIAVKTENSYSYIDIDKAIVDKEIIKVEEMANNIVFENIPVKVLYPTNAELKKMNIRKVNSDRNLTTRIVKIGELGVFPCTALHPNSTIEVQIIKVLSFHKQGDNFRVEFICGGRAISNYFAKYETINVIAKLLGSKEVDILGKVEGLSGELKKTRAENNSLKVEVADYEVQNLLAASEIIDNIRVFRRIYEDVDIKHINLLTTKLVAFPKVIVLLGIKIQDKTQLMFMQSRELNKISMNSLLKDAITLIDGKGGGSDFSAQGAGRSSNNLSSCIDYAFSKVKAALSMEPKHI